MADAQLTILIEAVDRMSGTVDSIEKKLDQTNRKIQQQTQTTSQVFQETTGSLLVLGEAASRVDSIFTSYQNLQIRVENSTERLRNAQDRLSDAQYEYNKLLQSGKAGSDDIRKAQLELDRAQRGLTISQNNLARVNNQIVGQMINMGVQVVVLIALLPKVTAAVLGLGHAISLLSAKIGVLNTVLGVVGIALAAIGVLYHLYTKLTGQAKDAVVDLNSIETERLKTLQATDQAQNSVIDSERALQELLEKPTEKQLEAKKKLEAAERKLYELRYQLDNATDNATKSRLNSQIRLAEFRVEKESKLYENLVNYERSQLKGFYEEQNTRLSEFFGNWRNQIAITAIAQQSLFNPIGAGFAMAGAIVSPLKTGSTKTAKKSWFSKQTGGAISETGMYMLHAGEYVVPKKGGGGNINIKIGAIYGVSSKQISEELYRRLRYSLST